MSHKRGLAEEDSAALKAGQRPENGTDDQATLDFEDEFEDEFESDDDDDVLEAGVDGRPDAEREADEAKGR